MNRRAKKSSRKYYISTHDFTVVSTRPAPAPGFSGVEVSNAHLETQSMSAERALATVMAIYRKGADALNVTEPTLTWSIPSVAFCHSYEMAGLEYSLRWGVAEAWVSPGPPEIHPLNRLCGQENAPPPDELEQLRLSALDAYRAELQRALLASGTHGVDVSVFEDKLDRLASATAISQWIFNDARQVFQAITESHILNVFDHCHVQVKPLLTLVNLARIGEDEGVSADSLSSGPPSSPTVHDVERRPCGPRSVYSRMVGPPRALRKTPYSDVNPRAAPINAWRGLDDLHDCVVTNFEFIRITP
ncbi:hypothetical protein BOTBODRAFT_49532, partial [Botryobasidium botryosum FD-172 SS1]